MEIYLLDMGQTKYGDSILITRGNRRILIDGGHPGDAESITEQLGEILQSDPPFDLDLLVVTHCHGDHIACLPELVENDIIRPKKALVADEKFGWGRDSDGDSPVDAMPSKKKLLVLAVQEGDYADLPDAELREFIQDLPKLEPAYKGMIKQFEDAGIDVIRYGRDDHSALEQSFNDFGFKILGPTLDHLLLCADYLSEPSDMIGVDSIEGIDDNSTDSDVVSKYRQIIRGFAEDAVDAEDAADSGAAKNNQSIVIKVEADGWNALLAGDMQFAKADVPGLKEEMDGLREVVRNEGPYDFVKLSHHTASNGLNQSVLDDYPDTGLFAHSGGRKDAGHPNKNALKVLKDNKHRLKFARTDRNGMIIVKKDNGTLKMIPSKGQLNTFTVNTVGDEEITPLVTETAKTSSSIVRENKGDGFVEVLTRIPPGVGKVTVTIEVDGQGTSPKKKLNESALDSNGLIGNGRQMPHLLFVTSKELLKRNIGEEESRIVIDTITKHAGIDLLDIPSNATTALQAAQHVRQKLKTDNYEGVVILGGYDVIPSYVLNTIDNALRQKLVELDLDGEDADDFTVWSDDLYGDKDGDLLPELPVSRIPDGRRADVLLAALRSPSFTGSGCFGIRNLARPFADITYSSLPGSANPIEVSETYGPGNITGEVARGAVYYMLHGSYRDGTCFWGETADGDEYEAISLANIPPSAPGSIVFTGCCWGALPVFQPAMRAKPGKAIVPRSPEESIALSYLLSGALAFIGCTGSHYSPLQAPYDYYGKPMHDYFWKRINQGMRPAEALFNAKKEYATNLPHSRKDSYSKAIELKIARQYTCLGLGW